MVGRQDLSVGMGTSISRGANTGADAGGSGPGGLGQGRKSLVPLSEEERDVRLAELMSFGVDLPNEMLITLLRFVGAVDAVSCLVLSCLVLLFRLCSRFIGGLFSYCVAFVC